MPSEPERIAALEVLAAENRRIIMQLHADIHSGPGVEWEQSIRGQLHRMRDAQGTADKLLEGLQEVRRTAQEQSRQKRTFRQWLIPALITSLALVPPYVLLFYFLFG